MLAIQKFKRSSQIQDGDEMVLIFHLIFAYNLFGEIFSGKSKNQYDKQMVIILKYKVKNKTALVAILYLATLPKRVFFFRSCQNIKVSEMFIFLKK
jgi:hypothetical protein